MHEFDVYIPEWLNHLFEEKNITENRVNQAKSKLYERARSRVRTSLISRRNLKKGRKHSELDGQEQAR